MRILVVEDDPQIGDGLKAGLSQGGYAVDLMTTLREATHALDIEKFDAVVLDIALPDGSGLDLLKKMRESASTLPVLLLTAKDKINDKIIGLDCGADDYMIKPFDLDELQARLRAIVRRRSGHADAVYKRGGLTVDPASFRVTLEGDLLTVSRREFAILVALLEANGRVLSRERLEQALYTWDEAVESNTIQVHIHHLRKKLGEGFIRTVRGVGYVIDQT